MKNKFLNLLLVPLSCLFLWIGCGPGSAQPIYHFGVEYNFKHSIVKVDHDTNEENFVFYYTDKDSVSDYNFYFTFTSNSIDTLFNSAEFEYADGEGNEIVFDEKGYYYFRGDKIINISYKNANEEIKSAIANEPFDIYVGRGPFTVPIQGYPSDSE